MSGRLISFLTGRDTRSCFRRLTEVFNVRKLRKYMKTSGEGAYDLADVLGAKFTTVYGWLGGDYHPSLKFMWRICKHYGDWDLQSWYKGSRK